MTMRITELLQKNTMILNLKSSSKADVIDELVGKLDRGGKLNDREGYKKAILAREEQSTTGIGEGIAIPHAKTASVKTPAIAFGRSAEGIDYEALDGQNSHLFFMIAASEGANNAHLETLSRLSSLLMDDGFRKKLMNAADEEEILNLIDEKEKEVLADEEPEEQPQEDQAASTSGETGKVLAVTACPTGIAHTYMAADSLKAKAKEKNIEIKVETNGSSGAKNQLTKAEIKNAVAIIVAADTKVEMERFKGKKVIQVPVAEGIRNPDKLLDRAVNGDAPVYEGSGKAAEDEGESKEKRSGFYKHLMNGVSNMLPFVVGGGILIAISFMFGIQAADPNHETYNPIAEALNTIGGGTGAFGLMIPVLAAFIAMSIADRPGFAAGMVGGYLAATGGGGFLGGLIAGFLAGYIVLLLKKLFANLPNWLEGLKPVLLYPVFGILITGLIMLFVVNEPVSFINEQLQEWLGGMGTTNLVLLGILLGGMMAVDLGGPINKAAFTFGIAMIDAGNFGPHAAIMAGGMAPPLGLALATTFFKNKFTPQERKAGFTCYFMGASFITEGAIPFAAADPGRVIPSAIVGSAIAGGLAMAFGIGLPAPHGGIFVFPVVQGNPLLYILAVLIGSAVTAVMVGLLKKPAKQG
jgi:fructose PTS system EIIBC or EIIC component